ncbi:MAG: response regulator [Planctomycetota bacterium]
MSHQSLRVRLRRIIEAAMAGNRAMAKIDLESLMPELPQDANAWIWQAWLAESPEATTRALNQALEIDPDNEIALAGLIWAEHLLDWEFEAEECEYQEPAAEESTCGTDEADYREDSSSEIEQEDESAATVNTALDFGELRQFDEPLCAEMELSSGSDCDACDADEADCDDTVNLVSTASGQDAHDSSTEGNRSEDDVIEDDEVFEPCTAELEDESEEYLSDASSTCGTEPSATEEELGVSFDSDQCGNDTFEEAYADELSEEAECRADETVSDSDEICEEQLSGEESDCVEESVCEVESAVDQDVEPVETTQQLDSFEFVTTPGFASGQVEASDLVSEATEEEPVAESTECEAEQEVEVESLATETESTTEPTGLEAAILGEMKDLIGETSSEVEASQDQDEPATTVEEATAEIEAEPALEETRAESDEPQAATGDDTEFLAGQSDSEQERPLILAVDDSPTVRKLVSMTLERVGYEVVTAADGVAALNLLAERLPVLILSDINMPRITGYKLCKLVKKHQRTRHIPVVMLSGKNGVFDKVRGQMVGAADYITKPFESHDLIDKVRQYALDAATTS